MEPERGVRSGSLRLPEPRSRRTGRNLSPRPRSGMGVLMGIRIYLDDLRQAPEGWARTYDAEETVDLIESREGEVEAVSLDHDLGENSLEGRFVAREMVRMMTEGKLRNLRLVRIHTSADGSGIGMEQMFLSQNPMVAQALPDGLRVVRIPGGDPLAGPGTVDV